MSGKNVDERIVQMQFNNQQFESGIKTSLSSLDKLQKGLKLDGATKGLNNLSNTASKFSLEGIASGVDSIAGKFTAMGIVGVTALANITNAAVNAGVQMVKSLTVDPIKAGLGEYETKMNAIQTILTNTKSKGTTLDDVNVALGELNKYADLTIYNFAQMTDNIGKMTAAGVGLEDSVSVVKGLANVAAGFGVDATKMAGATYQMSQALSTGYVQLMDWKSMEQAGMGGEMLQKELVATAKAMGVAIKPAENFRQSLKQGWLTTEVFVKTMEKMADNKDLTAAAQNVTTYTKLIGTMQEAVGSGWASTWEAIIGDKDQSTKLFTDLNNSFNALIGPSTEARIAMWKFWNENGGRDDIIEGLKNLFAEFQRIILPITGAWVEIFPPATGELLVDLSKKFVEFTKKFKMSGENLSHLITTFAGLFSILNLGKKVLASIGRGLGKLFERIKPVGGDFLDLTAKIGMFFIELDHATDKITFFDDIFTTIADTAVYVFKVLKDQFNNLKNIFAPIGEAANGPFTKLTEKLNGLKNADLSGVEEFVTNIKDKFKPFEWIAKGVEAVSTTFTKLVSKIKPIFAKVKEVFSEAFKGINLGNLVSIFNTGLLATVVMGITKFIKSLTSVTDGAGGFLKGITNILDGVRGCLTAYQKDIQAGTLIKIATAIAILAGSLLLMSLIDPARMTGAIGAITALFTELLASMAIFDKIAGSSGFKSMLKVSTSLILLSTAVLILAAAVKKMGQLSPEDLAKGVAGVTALVGDLLGAIKLMGSPQRMIQIGLGLMAFATAIRILTSSVVELATINPDSLIKGLLALSAILGGLMLFLKNKDLDASSIKMGAGLMLLAVAIRLMVNSVAVLGSLDPAQLLLGLGALGALILGITAFTQLVSDGKQLISAGAGLLLISGAMMGFALAVRIFGTMSPEQLGAGLLGFGLALGGITLALSLMPPNMPAIGMSFIALAAGMVIMAYAIQMLGGMPFEQLMQGLLGLGLALTMLVIAINAMTAGLAGAAALAIVSASLIGLAFALKIMGSMSPLQMAIALGTLAGAFLILGVAALVLAPLIPALLGLGAAMIVMGIGLAAIGAASIVMSIGMAAIAATGLAGVGVLLAIAAAMIPLTILAPALIVVGGALLILSIGIMSLGLGLTILGSGLGLLSAIGPQGIVMLQALASTSAQMASFAIELFLAGAALVLFGTGAILAGVGALLAGAGLMVLAIGMRMLQDVDLSNMEGIAKFTTDIVKSSIKLGLAAPGLLAGGAGLIVFGEGALLTGTGLAAITSGMTDVVNNLKSVPSTVTYSGNAITQAVKNMINAIVAAVKNQKYLFVNATKDYMQTGVNNINTYYTSFYNSGVNLVDGLIAGMNSKRSELSVAAAKLGQLTVDATNRQLIIESPSKAFAETGRFSVLGLVAGLKKYSDLAVNAATTLADRTIAPVMDLSLATSTAGSFSGSAFSRNQSMASSIATGLQNRSQLPDIQPVQSSTDLSGVLTVQVVNDKGEIIGIAQKAIKDLLRRESR